MNLNRSIKRDEAGGSKEQAGSSGSGKMRRQSSSREGAMGGAILPPTEAPATSDGTMVGTVKEKEKKRGSISKKMSGIFSAEKRPPEERQLQPRTAPGFSIAKNEKGKPSEFSSSLCWCYSYSFYFSSPELV